MKTQSWRKYKVKQHALLAVAIAQMVIFPNDNYILWINWGQRTCASRVKINIIIYFVPFKLMNYSKRDQMSSPSSPSLLLSYLVGSTYDKQARNRTWITGNPICYKTANTGLSFNQISSLFAAKLLPLASHSTKFQVLVAFPHISNNNFNSYIYYSNYYYYS